MIRFAPAEYYIVCISFAHTPDVWRPHYADCRTIRLHSSMASAQSELDAAAKRFHGDHVRIVKLTPEQLPVVSGQLSENQPAPTTTNTQGETS